MGFCVTLSEDGSADRRRAGWGFHTLRLVNDKELGSTMPVSSAEIESPVVERALCDSGLMRGILDQLPTGVYIVDRSRRILYWNGGAEQITGYLSQQVAGQACHGDLLMHCDASGHNLCGHDCTPLEVMSDGKPRECTVFLRHKLGHRLPVHVKSWPVRGEDGRIIGAVESFEEVKSTAHTKMAVLEAAGCLAPHMNAFNRKYGELKAAHALDLMRAYAIPFGWLRLDLDDTDGLERRFGHGIVDAAEKMIVRTINGNLSPRDRLSLWGRAEFRIEVHSCWRQGLADLAESLVVLVRASTLEWWGDSRRVTVSVAGTMAEANDDLESLEARVEGVFANCRASGGNRAAVDHMNTEEF